MISGNVFDVRRFSVHDGPGIRTAVFLKGCPLACPWCHNPEGRDPKPALLRRGERCVGCLSCVKACPRRLDPRREAGSEACEGCPDYGACARACPAEAIQQVGSSATVEELMDAIRADRMFYDESGGGVTFTGGEPLAQPAFLGALLDACKAEGIRSAIETTGYARREVLLDLARRADLLLFDLKVADAMRGGAITGVDYGLCLSNLEAVAAAEGPDKIIVRMPIIPGWNDDPRDIEAAAVFVAALGADGRKPAVHLLPYHDAAKGKYRMWGLDYPLAATPVPDDGALAAISEVFAARGLSATKGG